MSPTAARQNLILLGLVAVESRPVNERIAYLQAAASMIEEPELAERCLVTAKCLAEAEAAQLRLFNIIKPVITQ